MLLFLLTIPQDSLSLVNMKKYFLPLLFATIALGIIFPAGRHFKPILPFLLSTLLFFNFYHMKLEVRHFIQRGTLIYFLLVLLLLPWLVFNATQTLSEAFRIGIFLSAISPAAISGPIIVGMIKGSREIAVANVVIFNLLAPFSYTILMKLYFQAGELNIPIWPLMSKLLMMVFLPFILSLALKQSQRLSGPIQRISAYANVFFLLMIYTAISSSALSLRQVPGKELFWLVGTIFLIAGSFYLSGFLFGGTLGARKALAVNMGQKNCSLCIWLALANFGPLAAIPPTIYIIMHHLLNSSLIFYFNRKRSKT